jgi:hypothetical protein
MKRILLVRLSSLGDVLHTLPAATDIRRAFPDAMLDWAVEEAYVPLVRMHPGVPSRCGAGGPSGSGRERGASSPRFAPRCASIRTTRSSTRRAC